MNRKGSILDILFIIVVVFVVSITVLIAGVLNTAFRNNVAASGQLNATYFDKATTALHVFDYGMLMIVFGWGAAIWVLAWFVQSHPAFFMINFIAWVIIVTISATFTNMFIVFAQNPSIVATAETFPIMIHIMQNLPLICMLIGAVAIIIALGKSAGGRP